MHSRTTEARRESEQVELPLYGREEAGVYSVVGVANGGLELPGAPETGPPVPLPPCCSHLLVIILAPDNPFKNSKSGFYRWAYINQMPKAVCD